MTMELTYLAIPYTFDPDKSFEIANEVAAELMSEKKVVFSPISHSHKIADYLAPELRLSQEFWMAQDLPMLLRCNTVTLILIGDKGKELVENSKGCQEEIKTAEAYGIPIQYYYYEK